LPTDRIIAEWWLKSNRVTSLLESGKQPKIQPTEQISVPEQIYSWRRSEADLPKAAEVQSRNREQFSRAFSQGLAVLGYDRDEASNGSYLLGHWDEKLSYASEELL
jgi:predicted GNAT superfamily acetyltransferase